MANEIKKTKKARKPYPTHEERLELLDARIERLTKLNASRQELINKTEATLKERRDALAKSSAALEVALRKKAHIVEIMSRPAKPAAKLTPEQRIIKRREALENARAAKRREKEKREALYAALKQSGMSIDEFLSSLDK